MEQNSKTKTKSKSKFLPACIIALGIIAGALIIAKPKQLFYPLHSYVIRIQFLSQMKPAVKASSIRVNGVEYHENGNFYLVRYTLYGGQTATQYAEAGCALARDGSGNFSGSCVGGDFYDGNGKVQTKKIAVQVR